MEITEELIKKYFIQECTAEERAAVSAWFDAHPQELERYLDDESWQQFKPQQTVQPDLADRMLHHIEAHIEKPEAQIKAIGPQAYSRWAVAAGVLLAVSAGLFFLLRQQKGVPASQTAALAKPSAAAPVYDTVANTSAGTKIISLSDGSLVSLSPQSQIIYRKDFVQPHRDIQLTGEAVFKVAKDKTRPFTVFSGALSTTALGTRFKVTAFNSQQVKVMLYTGKVVIKQHQAEQPMADVYLTPGMQLVWQQKGNRPEVSKFTDAAERPTSTADGRTLVNGQVITFNNQSLQQVAATLQKAFGIEIAADDELLARHYYTGVVDLKKDGAMQTLTTIASLNRLKLVYKNEVYVLTR